MGAKAPRRYPVSYTKEKPICQIAMKKTLSTISIFLNAIIVVLCIAEVILRVKNMKED